MTIFNKMLRAANKNFPWLEADISKILGVAVVEFFIFSMLMQMNAFLYESTDKVWLKQSIDLRRLIKYVLAY